MERKMRSKRSAQMKNSPVLVGFMLSLFLISSGKAAEQMIVNDGNFHGDPPYLLEAGWKALLNGKNLDGWKYKFDANAGWVATRGVFWGGSNKPEQLRAMPKAGDRIVNSLGKPSSDIFTKEKFGDVELYLEFLMPANSNSGVYLQGLYEIQLWDSFGRDLSEHITNMCGAVYHYTKQIDNQYVGGVAPKVRAERPAGQWQSLQIWFEAPRFDSKGKKIANAKFVRVLLNGVLIQENVEREGPTRACMDIPEAAKNPLMLQGDHGKAAFRNIYIRPLRPLPMQ
jgi:hypothetical protein